MTAGVAVVALFTDKKSPLKLWQLQVGISLQRKRVWRKKVLCFTLPLSFSPFDGSLIYFFLSPRPCACFPSILCATDFLIYWPNLLTTVPSTITCSTQVRIRFCLFNGMPEQKDNNLMKTPAFSIIFWWRLQFLREYKPKAMLGKGGGGGRAINGNDFHVATFNRVCYHAKNFSA